MIIKGKDYIVETLELSNEDRNFIKICYDYSQRYPFKWNYLKKDIFTNEEIIYFKDTTMIISIDSIKLEKLLILFDFLKSLLNYRIIKKIIQKKEFVIAHFSETFQMEYIQRLDFLESISLYRKLLKELNLPDFRNYKIVANHGETTAQDMMELGSYIRDIIKLNKDKHNFRIFAPDETLSNRLNYVFEATNRKWNAKKIENEMDYPGQIKVNVIRETRTVDYAK
mgnify:CR=1 FL=1